VEIADEAHTTIVVTVPGLGDDIQAIKAGILEIADVYCVNKADLPAADRTAAHLKMMLSIGMRERDPEWAPPVLLTTATTGEGVEALMRAADEHAAFLKSGPGWRRREGLRAAAELRRRLQAHLVEGLLRRVGRPAFDAMVERLVARTIDPTAAVQELTGDSAGSPGGRAPDPAASRLTV
jgi:LAO/AO transport system kinase